MQSDPKILAETLLSASILEAIPDAVVAVNQQGVIIQVNSQTEALFGYTRDELIGQSVEMGTWIFPKKAPIFLILSMKRPHPSTGSCLFLYSEL